jgi:hypothetical protein
MKDKIIILAIVIPCITGCYHYGTYVPPPDGEQEAKAVTVKKPPRLILIRGVGVYYSPEADDDIFFYGGTWYYYSGIDWFVSESYKGPWEKILQETLPQVMFRVPPEKFKNVPPGWGEAHGTG